jgi:hypothetical protein
MRDKAAKSTRQLELPLSIAAEREIDGVQMGVLSNGATFLTIRGLARMCGVDHSMIVRITEQWIETPLKPREKRIRELVRQQGADDSVAFLAIDKNGTFYHAVPDAVCMAILEYYAFEAKTGNDQALKAFRALARKGFRDFIYAQVGYNPSGSIEVAWQQFQDRVSLVYHTVPIGFFCIFKEIADLFVTLVQGGATVGEKFLPDISVGVSWAKHWKDDNLDAVYGQRRQFDHNYPDYFPQSLSNPQAIYCYPEDAIPEFRKWMREVYVPQKMPNYLAGKIRDGGLTAPSASAVVEAFRRPSIAKQ